ncbi:hypothetical protein [Streptomyces sp. NPDC056883]|uniref:hypothetical protein n=1 Tax=Streptomyces sp. NPDC056883 TaxID=3345959 RepID=UPI0036A3769B
MVYVLFVGFVVMALVSLLAAVTGHRGLACDRHHGYTVPAAVAADPALVKKANELVAHWCTGAAVLSIPPLIPLFPMLTGDRAPLSIAQLAALAGYGFVVVLIASHPFEKIKQMGAITSRGPRT